MIEVKLAGIRKRYSGSQVEAVRDFSLTVSKGDLVCLLGPSGCGKTTTLKMIAGLLTPDAGSIQFDGVDVTEIPAEKRDAVMVFQNHLLFPFLSVFDNVGFGLRMRGLPRQEIRRRVMPILERMQLAGYEERKPSQLSGGQRQRVALARALVVGPKVLLLDEPLSNLDASLRDDMRELILSLKEELDLTIIFVTHDQEEAVLLADRIAVMFEGKLAQYATIPQLYRRPASVKIARFFGNKNVLSGTVVADGVATEAGRLRVADDAALPPPGGAVSVLVRPEEIDLVFVEGVAAAAKASAAVNKVHARVVRETYMGTHRRYTIDVAGCYWTVVDTSAAEPIAAGTAVVAAFARDTAWALAR